MKKALIVVDMQYDFCQVSDEDRKNKLGGALAVPGGNEIVPIINKLLPKFDLVIFTKDWHTKDMDGFASTHKGKLPFDSYINKDGIKDTLWADHCIAGTRGADIHDDIDFSLINGNYYIFKKGTTKNNHPYSAFGAKGLTEFLTENDVTDIVVSGLATDYCVFDTVKDSLKNRFKTTIIWDACSGISDDLTNVAIEMDKLGAVLTDYEAYLNI